MRELIIETVRRNPSRHVIKGDGHPGISPHPVIDPRKCAEASVVIYARPQQFEVTPEKLLAGIKIKVLALRKLSHEGLSHRSEPQLSEQRARELEAWDAGYVEGMFLEDRGYACECPGFNISAIKGNTLFTPSRGILVGITRNTVMEMASADGMNVETGFYTVFDFTSADEVMMTNTVAGISPVTNIDGWPIGDGKPGRKTMEWQDRYVSWLATGRHGTQVFPEAWF